MIEAKKQTVEERKETEMLVLDLTKLSIPSLKIINACISVLSARDKLEKEKSLQQ